MTTIINLFTEQPKVSVLPAGCRRRMGQVSVYTVNYNCSVRSLTLFIKLQIYQTPVRKPRTFVNKYTTPILIYKNISGLIYFYSDTLFLFLSYKPTFCLSFFSVCYLSDNAARRR